MTTAEVARALRARRVGRGKYMAKCPAHRERTGSLSVTDMGAGNTRLHCFGGCAQADVLRAAGLTWKDLRPGNVSPEIRRRMTMGERKESLDRQLGLVMWLGAVEKGKRAYWAAAERRIRDELGQLRCALEPEQVVREWQERQFQQKVRRVGFWKEFETSTLGRALRRQYGVD